MHRVTSTLFTREADSRITSEVHGARKSESSCSCEIGEEAVEVRLVMHAGGIEPC